MTHAFKHVQRVQLTDQQKARLFLERGGRCAGECGRKLKSGDKWTVEHVHSLGTGGDNSWDNLAIICSWCKPAKDAKDAGQRAKGRAIAVACVVPLEERQKSGRPIPGSKRSGWRHKVNGKWERR